MNTPAVDGRELRNALGRFATGVCIVTSRAQDGRTAALTINSFCSVSLEPPLVAWYLNEGSPSVPVFKESEYFAVHVLSAAERQLASHFAKPSDDKFSVLGDRLRIGLGNAPVLSDALACFQCRTLRIEPYGDHFMILGEVERFSYGSELPLLFHAGRYMEHGINA